jgi:hypothetical protein
MDVALTWSLLLKACLTFDTRHFGPGFGSINAFYMKFLSARYIEGSSPTGHMQSNVCFNRFRRAIWSLGATVTWYTLTQDSARATTKTSFWRREAVLMT